MLSVKSLCKIYQAQNGEISAIEDVSFTLPTGKFLSIVGPSGCGKSTLLSMIAGLEKKSGGEVLLDSRPVNRNEHKIGYMLQKDYLLPWRNIYKNVCFGLEITGAKTPENLTYVDQLLKTYGLWEFREKYPSQLSGGMRQRAALIRTLAVRPTLLLLDEAFSALDYQTRLQVTDDVFKILRAEKISAVLVTHDIPEAICMGDCVLVLSERPAKVKLSLNISLLGTPLQRRGNKEFRVYFERIWKEMSHSEDRTI